MLNTSAPKPFSKVLAAHLLVFLVLLIKKIMNVFYFFFLLIVVGSNIGMIIIYQYHRTFRRGHTFLSKLKY